MSVNQAEKVLDLLEYYARVKRPASLAEISQALGWPKSSTFSLLQSLSERGFLYEPRARAGYYPSPRWLALTQQVANAEPLPDLLRTLVKELCQQTGETVVIGGPAGVNAIFLDVQESSASIRYFAQIGQRLPIHASATGRAILSQYTLQERMALYRRVEFHQHSPSTPISIEGVEAKLREATDRGWHQSLGDFSPDLVGIGLPLSINERRLSLVVAGPFFRMTDRIPDLAAAMQRMVAYHRADMS